MNQELQILRKHPLRILAIAAATLGLTLIFILQQADVLAMLCQCSLNGAWHFALNKAIRLILNDVCMLAIIHCWFWDTKVLRLAFWIQVFDLFLLLPAYFVLKLTLEGDSEISSPLLSQLHRIIVNPTLMILLFPAIYFQRIQQSTKQT